MNALALHPGDIAIAAIVLLVDGLLSIAMRLRVHRALAIASLRMMLQLIALGFVLRAVFRVDAAWLTFALVLVMTVAAAREAAARPQRRLRRGHYMVSFASVARACLAHLPLCHDLHPSRTWRMDTALRRAGGGHPSWQRAELSEHRHGRDP
jgi:ABC-type uncharacterized transport system, permease component